VLVDAAAALVVPGIQSTPVSTSELASSMTRAVQLSVKRSGWLGLLHRTSWMASSFGEG